MINRHWMIEDVFGRRWRLWTGWMQTSGGLPREHARMVMRELVTWTFRGVRRRDDACFTLLAVHDELTGEALSSTDWYRDDLDSLHRIAERVSDTLGSQAACGRLRVERAPELHTGFALEDAPDTLREPESSPRSVAPARDARADWISVVVRDQRGEPLPNVRCRITSPGRGPVDIASDANGRVLLRGTEAGSCAIELPDIDAREWDVKAG